MARPSVRIRPAVAALAALALAGLAAAAGAWAVMGGALLAAGAAGATALGFRWAADGRYGALLERIPDVVFALDTDGRILSLNQAFEDISGWRRDEWLGRPFADLVHPDDLAHALAVYQRVLQGEYPPAIEARVRTRTGEWIHAEVTSAPRFSGGVVTGTLGVGRDITARRTAEAALRESEERLRAVLANTPVALFVCDAAGTVTLSEGRALEALGRQPGELVGHSLFDEYRDHPRLLDLLRRALAGESVGEVVELRGVALEGWITPTRDGDGRVTGALGVARDVSERGRIEHALQQSEEKFAKAFRSSPNPILITRLRDGLVVDVNDAFIATTGFTREDAVGRTTADLIWPDPERRAVLVEELETHGRVRDLELRMRTKAGSVLDVLVSIETITLAGEPHTIGVAVDITDRSRAARQTQETLSLLTATLEATADGIIVTDLNGRIASHNRKFVELWGLGSMVGITVADAVARAKDLLADPDAFAARVEAIRGDPAAVTHDTLFFKDGRVVERSSQPQRLGDEIVGRVWSFRDMTERHRAEAGLREAEEQQARLRDALMASAVDWTLTFDAIASPILILGEQGRVRRVNRTARELAGRASYADLIGLPVESVASGEPWRTMGRLAADVRREGRSTSLAVTPEGRGRSWYITANPTEVPGEERRVIVLARDITDLVELERSLRRTETMSALGALVAGVAHEVRNPLFALSATVDAFEARFGVQEQTARYTQTLRREVRRLGDLMRELLEWGKPGRLDLADASLDALVHDLQDHAGTLPRPPGVTLRSLVPEGLPPVRIDISRMRQVLTNLIENALQHSPQGGEVVLRTGAVQDGDAAWIELAVSDQGPGFRPEDLPHIFEPFFTRRRGGTGLGLSIVQRIVEQHDGTIIARNRPEGGAEMVVRLRPAAHAATPSVENRDRAASTHPDR